MRKFQRVNPIRKFKKCFKLGLLDLLLYSSHPNWQGSFSSGVKSMSLLISLTLITTFILIINVTFTRAEEIAGINPDLGFGYAVLLGGESVTLSTTTATPFDVYIAGVVSIGSPTISATVTGITSTARGWWWVVLTGNAPGNWYDFSFGVSFGVAPNLGKSTTIDINSILCIGFVMGGLILDPTTVSAESPVKYSLQIN